MTATVLRAPCAERDRAAAELAHRFPGVCAWWGSHTRCWWAVAQDRYGRHRLVEAPDPVELGRALAEAGVPVRPVVPRYARQVVPIGVAGREVCRPRPAASPRVAPRRASPRPGRLRELWGRLFGDGNHPRLLRR